LESRHVELQDERPIENLEEPWREKGVEEPERRGDAERIPRLAPADPLDPFTKPIPGSLDERLDETEEPGGWSGARSALEGALELTQPRGTLRGGGVRSLLAGQRPAPVSVRENLLSQRAPGEKKSGQARPDLPARQVGTSDSYLQHWKRLYVNSVQVRKVVTTAIPNPLAARSWSSLSIAWPAGFGGSCARCLVPSVAR